MSDETSQEDRIAALERRLGGQSSAPAAAGSTDDRFVDRELPGDLFMRTLSGDLDVGRAKELAAARWRADEVRGGSMNDLVRQQLDRQSWSGSLDAPMNIKRDEKGRFVPKEPSMPEYKPSRLPNRY